MRACVSACVHTPRIGNCLSRSMLMYFVLCRARVHWWSILITSQVVLITVHPEKDERWLWRATVLGDFVVHCAMPRDSKLETGSKKGTSTGVRTGNVLLCKWSERPGFIMVFPQFSVFRATPGRNPFLVMANSLENRLQNTIGRAFHGGLPNKIRRKLKI